MVKQMMNLERSVYHLDRQTLKQYLSENSFDDLVSNLAKMIQTHSIDQFQDVMTIIKNEQDKVKQHSEGY